MKICTKCKIERNDDNFIFVKSRNKLRSSCKLCEKTYRIQNSFEWRKSIGYHWSLYVDLYEFVNSISKTNKKYNEICFLDRYTDVKLSVDDIKKLKSDFQKISIKIGPMRNMISHKYTYNKKDATANLNTLNLEFTKTEKLLNKIGINILDLVSQYENRKQQIENTVDLIMF